MMTRTRGANVVAPTLAVIVAAVAATAAAAATGAAAVATARVRSDLRAAGLDPEARAAIERIRRRLLTPM